MFCPECGAGFRLGLSQCTDCDVALVHEPAPEAPRDLHVSADTVIVFRSCVPGETDMVSAALEEVGIRGIIRRGIAGGLQLSMLEGGFTPGQELVLAVPRVAEAEAREVIESLRPADVGNVYETHTSEEQNASGRSGPPPVARATARILLILLLAPIGLGVVALLLRIVLSIFGAA